MMSNESQDGNGIVKKLEAIRDMKLELAPVLAKLKRMESEAKQEILEMGKAPSVEGVSVTIRKGYTRSSWDNRSLMGFAAVHPEILEFCKKSEVGSTVSIKYQEVSNG